MRLASIVAVALTALTLPAAGIAQGPAPAPPPPSPPTQPVTWPPTGGGTEFQDNWEETAARPGGRAARGFLKGGGGSTQAINIDIVDLLTCIFCVVPTGGQDASKASKPRGSGSLTLRTTTSGRCVVGARYPALQLRLDGKDYRLGGVTVAKCSAARAADPRPVETISLNYDTVSYR